MSASVAANGVDSASDSSALVLQTFHKDFGEHQTQLTTLVVDGEPWFKGPDAAAALGYSAPAKAVRTYVDEEDRQRLDNLKGTISVPFLQGNEGACRSLDSLSTNLQATKSHRKPPKAANQIVEVNS